MKRNIALFLLIISAVLIAGCKQSDSSNQPKEKNQKFSTKKECIKRVISIDDSLGIIRNNGSKTISLSETIDQYVAGIENINFEDCPKDFKSAFADHKNAWLDMRSVTDKYPDMRGEMHDLFNKIQTSKDSTQFNAALKSIWDTWGDVENSMLDYSEDNQ